MPSRESKETIDKFFDNFEAVCAAGISPDRIINYDETNLTDDPGIKKFICKRGSKYPERVMDSTKSATSVMFAGAADGTLLEPYVVYKAEHLWDTWITGGPPGTQYNRSRSGWLDGVCFEDWFTKVIGPYAKNRKESRSWWVTTYPRIFPHECLNCAAHITSDSYVCLQNQPILCNPWTWLFMPL